MPYINKEAPLSNFGSIINSLKSNFKFSELKINKSEFDNFIERVDYPLHYKSLFGAYHKEKLLEHFLSIKLLNFTKNEVFIDIAASQSYFADYIYKNLNFESYKQDIVYRRGISCSKQSSVPFVGGDAAELPFKNEHFTKMTLHCSLEHFENTADINFIREAERVLQKKWKNMYITSIFW